MKWTRFALLCVMTSAIGIVWNAATVQTAQARPPAATAAADIYKNVYNGWKWWHVYCYRCHGTNAIATSVAPSLIDPYKRMTLPTFVSTARNGRPTLGMQSWRKLLDDKQLAQIYLYVQARTDKVLPPGRPDEVGPKGGPWVPPAGWPKQK
jgi:mono/diheme cytochrome c family protein